MRLAISLLAVVLAQSVVAQEWQHNHLQFDPTGSVTLHTLSGVTKRLSNTNQQGLQSSASPTVLSVVSGSSITSEAIAIGKYVYRYSGNGQFQILHKSSFDQKYTYSTENVAPQVNAYLAYGMAIEDYGSEVCDWFNGYPNILTQVLADSAHGSLAGHQSFCRNHSNPYKASYRIRDAVTGEFVARLNLENNFHGDGFCQTVVLSETVDMDGNILEEEKGGARVWRTSGSCKFASDQTRLFFKINHYLTADSKYQRVAFEWDEYSAGAGETRTSPASRGPAERPGILIYHDGSESAILTLASGGAMQHLKGISKLPPPRFMRPPAVFGAGIEVAVA